MDKMVDWIDFKVDDKKLKGWQLVIAVTLFILVAILFSFGVISGIILIIAWLLGFEVTFKMLIAAWLILILIRVATSG